MVTRLEDIPDGTFFMWGSDDRVYLKQVGLIFAHAEETTEYAKGGLSTIRVVRPIVSIEHWYPVETPANKVSD